MTSRRKVLAAAAIAAACLLVGGTIASLLVYRAVEKVGFGPDAARDALPSPAPDDDGPPVASPDSTEAFLVVGSDERAGLGGSRADVIMVGLLPADGASPILFSLPRDLWVDNPCAGGSSRINAGLNGCGDDVGGPDLLAIMVEDFTGLQIDHYVGIDFVGFRRVIDAVGGVQICVDHPVREGRKFELPAGCTRADGDLALDWVRSRHTQEQVNGHWRTMPGVDDLTRNERQQDVMLQMLGKVSSFDTVRNLYSFAAGISDSVTIGGDLGIGRSVRTAWSLRDLNRSDIRRFSLPVEPMTTSGGAQVLLPTEPFAETIAREIPDAAEALDLAGVGDPADD